MSVASHNSPLRPVNRTAPCPICEKPDWCSRSTDGEVIICMRVRSNKQTKNGGYLHLTTDPQNREPYIKPIRPVASAERRHEVYSALLDRISLSHLHSEHLLKTRRLSETTITRVSFATVPNWANANAIAAEMDLEFDLDHVPGFYIEDGKRRLKFAGTNGFFIPIRDSQHRISALQIRRDSPYKERRYLLFSSATGYRDGVSIELEKGASSGVPSHFARAWQTREAVVITEGALKAEVCAEHLEQPVIGLVGVGTFKDRFGWTLRTAHPTLTRVAIAFDADSEENEAVAHQLNRLRLALTDAQLDVTILSWPITEGKGFDDYLLHQEVAGCRN